MPTFAAPDGRTLGYELYGPRDGVPIVGIHGTPGSRLGRFPIGDPYAEVGVCMVQYDRPGFGLSTRQPGRSVANCATDVAALADELGWERFAVVGGSGGGPHALACGALLPDRVTRATCDVGIAPIDAEDLDFFDGMVEGNVIEFTKAQQGEAEFRAFVEPQIPELLSRLTGDMRDVLGPDYPLSEADREVLARPEFGEELAKDMREAFRQGADGWVDDGLAFVKGWGFSIDSIKVPVKVRYGPDDTLVPAAHGRWLAKHVPGAIEELKPGGHLGSADPALFAAQLRWLAGKD
ncbi:MAG: alpha/beta hydrolase [Sporichthyaceae bacterium]|nr:alpha/beta hydrolase [Sporichthyaceae bacterium]